MDDGWMTEPFRGCSGDVAAMFEFLKMFRGMFRRCSGGCSGDVFKVLRGCFGDTLDVSEMFRDVSGIVWQLLRQAKCVGQSVLGGEVC